MNLLSFVPGILYIFCKVVHRACNPDAYTLALLLDSRLHSCPYDIIYSQLVAEYYLLVVIDIYYGSKPLVVRSEVVQECRILTEVIRIVGIVHTCEVVAKEEQQSTAHSLFQRLAACDISLF